ncbi:hypothetical protein F5B18DRAFT_654777 [Nemania serpens]|nr:hypothetical protein F5B18DRAFT_654777 [Nemania serpens]
MRGEFLRELGFGQVPLSIDNLEYPAGAGDGYVSEGPGAHENTTLDDLEAEGDMSDIADAQAANSTFIANMVAGSLAFNGKFRANFNEPIPAYVKEDPRAPITKRLHTLLTDDMYTGRNAILYSSPILNPVTTSRVALVAWRERGY